MRQTMSDASGLTTYRYDDRDRLLEKATPQGTLFYTYDQRGNVKDVWSDLATSGGTYITYEYDANNQLAAVHDHHSGTTRYTYDEAGRNIGYTYPNDVTTSYTLDELNRIRDIQITGPSGPLARFTYHLNAAGHRTGVDELNGRMVRYEYDQLYRLTKETISNDPVGPNGEISYILDPVGNRLTRTSTVAEHRQPELHIRRKRPPHLRPVRRKRKHPGLSLQRHNRHLRLELRRPPRLIQQRRGNVYVQRRRRPRVQGWWRRPHAIPRRHEQP